MIYIFYSLFSLWLSFNILRISSTHTYRKMGSYSPHFNYQMWFFTIAITHLFITFPSIVHTHQDNTQCNGVNADRSALLAFKKGIVADPQNMLGNWNETIDICYWKGVSCSDEKRVITIDLKGGKLEGTLSPFLSNLSCLQAFELSDNLFQGPIPAELGDLSRLELFGLQLNQMQDEIPESFGRLTNLRFLDLSKNQLSGQLPSFVFYNCTKLLYIDLSNNFFVDSIPSQIGNYLPSLISLQLYLNKLTGIIPPSLSNLSHIEDLDLEYNYLTGTLPSEIVRHMPQLKTLHLSFNHLSSNNNNTNLIPFFTSISNLTHLRELELASNWLGGELPSIIGLMHVNISELHLEDNFIRGVIPANITNLSNLTLLNLSSNLLNGSIPSEISLLPKLERLCLSNNSLQGSIPSLLGNLSHLGLLDLSKNKLSGEIPKSLSNLAQLRRLILSENLLSGTIPPALERCTSLEMLDLSHNKLTGTVPEGVAGLTNMVIYFNVSNNLLSGMLPMELSKMDKVRAIDLSSNNFSGEIPPNLGSCEAVELIDLSHNLLQGTIPESLGKLLSLQLLDLSSNSLSGEIPASLNNCDSLAQLNLSFNNFNGSIPRGHLFDNLTIESFQGNTHLCGLLTGLTSCDPIKKSGLHSRKFLILIVIPVSASVFLLTICFVVGFKRFRRSAFRRKEGVSSKYSLALKSGYPRITYRELAEATGGFEESRLIGSGSFGHVYKGVLRDGSVVAVKVLQFETSNSTKSFNRECQVLKRIRHRNLMRIITACSLPDFKALVLPFMANGSLDSHLYRQNCDSSELGLVERVNICSDIAEGMAYLHHHSPVQVIHGDLKPSNILLNDDMTALVTDFGIARLVMTVGEGNMTVESTTNSTANLLCGSIGYIAPEYGLGRNASAKGDVYSFGILVLEMVTRKRPTDEMFSRGVNLQKWVKSHYHARLEKVIDSSLMRASRDQSSEVKNMWNVAICELLEMGLLCTQDTPSMRPTMLDAADDLERLKRYLSGDTTATFASSLGISSSTVTGGDDG